MQKLHNLKKVFEGRVVSTKMHQTALVLTKRLKLDSKYKKRYWSSKKYKAHNPENRYKEGDVVLIQESRPLSRDKRWVILGRVSERDKRELTRR